MENADLALPRPSRLRLSVCARSDSLPTKGVMSPKEVFLAHRFWRKRTTSLDVNGTIGSHLFRLRQGERPGRGQGGSVKGGVG